jgi:glycosyltransferase involved in cell wall biosynthesis
MPASPTISVVIPAYNAEQYLRAAVESVLAQTYRDFECIVVDDGSTDQTPAIIADLATHDSRVRPLSVPHGGIVAALNAGIEAARADLIARMDGDDLCLPHRFARQLEHFRQDPGCVAVGARTLLIDPYDSPLWETDQPLESDQIEASLLRGNGLAICHPVVMMRKRAVNKAGGYLAKYQWVEDLDLFLRLAEIGRLANVPEVLLHYRQHFGSVNKHKATLQEQVKEQLLADAHQRRGLPVPTREQIEHARQLEPMQQLQMWARAALRQGNPAIARRHAMAAVKMSPLRYDAWWLAYRSFRGRAWNHGAARPPTKEVAKS